MSFIYDNKGITPMYQGYNFPSVIKASGTRPKYVVNNNIIGGYIELSHQMPYASDFKNSLFNKNMLWQINPSTYMNNNPTLSRLCILAIPVEIRFGYNAEHPIQNYTSFRYAIISRNQLTSINAPIKTGKIMSSGLAYSSPSSAPPWRLLESSMNQNVGDISFNNTNCEIDGTLSTGTIQQITGNGYPFGIMSEVTYSKFTTFLSEIKKLNNNVDISIPYNNSLSAFDDVTRSVCTKITTNLPIFTLSNYNGFYNWWKTGAYDESDNVNDIEYGDIDFSTDWNVYVKGKSPSIKLVWDSPNLITFINSVENDGKLSLDRIKVEISYDNSSDTRVINGFTPYTDKTYTTTYSDLAKKHKLAEWEQFLSEVLGSVTGIGTLNLYFRIYNDHKTSALCYVGIPYNSTPTVYGIHDSSITSDNSTVTITYGASGEDDDGYIDPTEPTPPDEIITNGGTIPTTNGGFTGVGLLSTTYSLTRTQVEQLGSFIWGDNFYTNIKLLNNSPIENIVSIKALPVVVSGTTANIILGNVDTGVSGSVVSNYHDTIINIGSIAIVGMYGSFLDYSPFTKLTIFLPFIGFKELDTSLFMGKILSVKYIFDLLTGCAKACLSANDIYVMSFDGSAGIDIPITASNRASVEAGYITTLGTSLLSASANPIGAVASTLSMATVQNHYQTQGSYSPSCGAYETRNCYIIYDRPVVQYPTTYAHNFGKPCALSQTIGNLNGYTEVSKGVDLSNIPCTASEKEMIRAILMDGFFA